jgi:cytochrome c biogenesis protein CcdA/thiol-disulfide isomerase/thioredoxin
VVALYIIGFVAGLVAGISPCILPVLPVVLVAGTTGVSDRALAKPGAGAARRRTYRAYAVIAGLVLSFSTFTLAGSSLLSALGLPQDFLRDAGLVVLGVVAAGLIAPPLGHLLERPFSRLVRRQPSGNAGAFVLGLGLGVVFVPCAGPVLSAITVAGATHHVGLSALALTVAFSAGAALPLLVVAMAGQRVAERTTLIRAHAPVARRIGGVVMIMMTLAIAFNLTDGLQRAVPGYTSTLQRNIEGTAYATKELSTLTGTRRTSTQSCEAGSSTLESCGRAPEFAGITSWLNTPQGRPLTLAELRGKVVLVDFWTYSCINCQRSLPHVEAWYSAYHDDGLEVVGVHTPEFAFEHVVSNVAQAAKQLGVDYPIAVDNEYRTWTAYGNEYWPAEYLIDANGEIRHEEFGEGDYGTTESLIRELLVAADPSVTLPRRTDVPDLTPTQPITPESYLGYQRLQNFAGSTITENRPGEYQFPASLPANELAFSGTWTVGPEEITSGPDASLALSFQATDVYLVLGGAGTVEVAVGGTPTQTLDVTGIPRLYTLVNGPRYRSAVLTLGFSPGVKAYDFTFG